MPTLARGVVGRPAAEFSAASIMASLEIKTFVGGEKGLTAGGWEGLLFWGREGVIKDRGSVDGGFENRQRLCTRDTVAMNQMSDR